MCRDVVSMICDFNIQISLSADGDKKALWKQSLGIMNMNRGHNVFHIPGNNPMELW